MGEDQRIRLWGGISMGVGKKENKTRKVFFTKEGIDIQDDSAKSMAHSIYGGFSSNLTFPGSVLQNKLEKGGQDIEAVIELWEHETGLTIDGRFSSNSHPGFACRACKEMHEPCVGGRPCERCKEREISCVDQ
ncbi:hypothetical protein KCV07_g1984, partial [Aureobasidium melanogenum]